MPSPDALSLRDWFAGHVLAAAMTRAEGLAVMHPEARAHLLKLVAELAYESADAMLKVRALAQQEGRDVV